MTSSDTIIVQLFNSEGYQVANNKVQSFLIPEEITGNLTVSSFSSTSKTILAPITLSFNFILQNALTNNNALIIEQNTSYVKVPSVPINCYINGNKEKCDISRNETVVTVSDASITSGEFKI